MIETVRILLTRSEEDESTFDGDTITVTPIWRFLLTLP